MFSFWENRVFAFWRQDPRWRIPAILDFRGPIKIVGSLKSFCTTSYRSPIEAMALNCLLFLRKCVFFILATDRQTDEQINRPDAWSRSRCRERRLNKDMAVAHQWHSDIVIGQDRRSCTNKSWYRKIADLHCVQKKVSPLKILQYHE